MHPFIAILLIRFFKDGIGAATAATAPSVGLTSHTSPFCNDYNKF